MTTSPALQRIGVIPRRRPSKRIAGRKREPGQYGSRPMVDEAQGRRPRRRQPDTGWSSGSAGHGGRRDHACTQRAGGVMTLCDPACRASSVGTGPSTKIGLKRSGLDSDSEAAEDHALPVEGPVRRNMLHARVDHRLVHAFDARPALRPVDSRQDHRAVLCQSAIGITPSGGNGDHISSHTAHCGCPGSLCGLPPIARASMPWAMQVSAHRQRARSGRATAAQPQRRSAVRAVLHRAGAAVVQPQANPLAPAPPAGPRGAPAGRPSSPAA